jgi:hypothetical protein
MGNGMDDAKVDYRKILFHLQNTGEESFGRKCECDEAISKCIAKIPDTLFGCTSCIYNPNIQGYYAIMGTVSCCSRTAGIITRTVGEDFQ